MYCNQCGNQLPDNSLFCNHCGTRQPQSGAALSQPNRPQFTPRPARRGFGAPPPPQPAAYYQANEAEEYEDEEEYEEEELVQSEEPDADDVIFRIIPAFYNVGAAYVVTIILAILIVAGAAYVQLPLRVALIIASVCFIFPIYLHIQLRRVVYTLTPVKIEIESGIFSQNVRNIPLRQVQDVTVNQTLRERLLGVGDVVIDSAAVEGKIVMSDINDPRKHADLILDQLENWID